MKKTIIITLITLLLTSCHQDSWEIETKETGYTITSLDALNKLNNNTVNHLLFSVKSEDSLNIDIISHSFTNLPLTLAQANASPYSANITLSNSNGSYELELSTLSLTDNNHSQKQNPQLADYIKTDHELYYIIMTDQRYILYYETEDEIKKILDFYQYDDFYHQNDHIYLKYSRYNGSPSVISEITQGIPAPLTALENIIQKDDTISHLNNYHANQPFYAIYERITGKAGFEVHTSYRTSFYFEPALFFQPLQDYIITQRQTSERMLTKIITLDDEEEYDIDLPERIYAELFLDNNTFINEEAITYDEYSYSIINIDDFHITKTLLPFQEHAHFFKINEHEFIACITTNTSLAEYYYIVLN